MILVNKLGLDYRRPFLNAASYAGVVHAGPSFYTVLDRDVADLSRLPMRKRYLSAAQVNSQDRSQRIQKVARILNASPEVKILKI